MISGLAFLVPVPAAGQMASPTPSPSPSPGPVLAQPGEVWLSELLPNPAGTDTDSEWLELRNTTDKTLDISGLEVRRENDTLVVAIPAGTTLGPQAYLQLSELSGTLVNSGDTLRLVLGGLELDRVSYDDGGQEGWSWARVSATEGAWTAEPTPGQPNAVAEPSSEPPVVDPGPAPTAATAASAPAAKTTAKTTTTKKASTKKAAAKKASAKNLPKSGPDMMLYVLPLALAAAYGYKRWIAN